MKRQKGGLLLVVMLLLAQLTAAQTAAQRPAKINRASEVSVLIDNLKQALAERKRAATLTERDQMSALNVAKRACKDFVDCLGKAVDSNDDARIQDLLESSEELGIKVKIDYKRKAVWVRFPDDFWKGTIKY